MTYKKNAYRYLLSTTLAAGLATQATAQHADFVLFGYSDPAIAAQSAQQTFVHPITAP